MSYRRGGKSGYEGQIAGLYDLGATLGKGHYAVVKAAKHVFTGEKVAVKVIDKLKLDDVSRTHLYQEVRCMKLVQHPNVLRLYEVIDTQTKLYLILELGDGGDLYDYIMRQSSTFTNSSSFGISTEDGAASAGSGDVAGSTSQGRCGGVNESSAMRHFAQLAFALAYCHSLHVVHRDLKPENCLFVKDNIKLSDFGFSNKFTPGRMLRTSCGSLQYSAPEILLGDEYDPPAVDVWSLGVILYMLVCGVAPFQDATDGETLIRIMDCRYTIPHHVSQPCRDLISRMLRRVPTERLTLDSILSHPWLQHQSANLRNPTPHPLGPTAMSSTPWISPLSNRWQSSSSSSSGSRTAPSSPNPVVPLVQRDTLSDADHCFIVQRIVDGKIATRDQITQSLERSAYNHVTATYDLLAEQLLKKRNKLAPPSADIMTHPKGNSPPFLTPPSPLTVPGQQSSPFNREVVCPDGGQVNIPPPTSSLNGGSLSSQIVEPTSTNSYDPNTLTVYARSSGTTSNAADSRKNSLPKCIKRCSLIREEENEEGSASDVSCENEPHLSEMLVVNGAVPAVSGHAHESVPGVARKRVTVSSGARSGSGDKLIPDTLSLSNGRVSGSEAASTALVSTQPNITHPPTSAMPPMPEPRRSSGRAGAPKLSLVMPVISGDSVNVNAGANSSASNSSSARSVSKLGLNVPERSLRKVVSSPQLKMLNQICEEEDMEREDEDEEEHEILGGSGERNHRIMHIDVVPTKSERTGDQQKLLSGKSNATAAGASSVKVDARGRDDKPRPVAIKSHSAMRPWSSNKTVKLRDLSQVVSDTESEVAYHGSADRSGARNPERASKLRRFSVGERNAPSGDRNKKCVALSLEVGDKVRRFSTGERKRSVEVRNGLWMKGGDSEFGHDLAVEKATADILEVTKHNTWNSCGDLSLDSRDANSQGTDRDKGAAGLRSRYTHGCALASELRQRRSEGMAVVEAVNLARRTSLRGGTIRFRARDFGSLVDKFSSSEISGGGAEKDEDKDSVS